MINLNVDIADLNLKNPVTTASGTFGFGEEFKDFIDLSKLGGIFVKGLTILNREGNDYPRMAETASGMLNAVGLQNKGIDYFINSGSKYEYFRSSTNNNGDFKCDNSYNKDQNKC